LWGLSKKQFELLYGELSGAVETDLKGVAIDEALVSVPLPPHLKFRWSVAATQLRGALGPGAKPRQSVLGLSKGTAIAVALNDLSLGFRPERTPENTIELVVEAKIADVDHWPIGWPLEQPVPQVLPELFELTAIELDQSPMLDVAAVVSELTSAPVLIDYSEMTKRRIQPAKVVLSHPLKRASWSQALRSMLVPHKLDREYWQDEAGRAFVWVTPTAKPRPDPR
jgi:hypothetical protein